MKFPEISSIMSISRSNSRYAKINKINRPFRITLLGMISLFFSLWNILRLIQTIIFWNTLDKYAGRPLDIAISGGMWSLVGLILCFGLWRGEFWSWYLTFGTALGFEFYYWLDRLKFQGEHTNWPFSLVTSVIFLVIIMVILFSSRTTKFIFKRNL
jgi:hypothetical protein